MKTRFIPAWAGNTVNNTTGAYTITVHPRVGGEHMQPSPFTSGQCGSSPRGRGTPLCLPHYPRQHRFIPAWAGNTTSRCCRTRVTSVHPRVGGEHLAQIPDEICTDGSSPRGRGTHLRTPLRGTLRRFIPAWAGNTALLGSWLVGNPVHPRVGGEHEGGGRGVLRLDRFIPAWAGNT